MPAFRIVCEGDTDFVVLDAALSAVYGEHTATMIQPEKSLFAGRAYTEMGSGWRGVKKWCEQARDEFGGLKQRLGVMLVGGADALIIHVDADIADHLDCRHPCPPASDTADAVRSHVLRWGGEKELPDGVVLCVPAQSTETWVIAALDPGSLFVAGDVECKDAEAYLCGRKGPKLVARKSGKGHKGYRKHTGRFAEAAKIVRDNWPRVRATCSQASRFTAELGQALIPK